MDASVLSALYGFGGVVVTSVVGIIVAKVNNKKDVTINDRQLLSQDQQQFYDMVMNQVKALQDRADLLENEVIKWKAEALQLRTENTELNAKVNHLEQSMGG
ncbi:hypothetical protein [Peribacillus frigoritolerans]|uniref:Holin n=1 Tax=Peribacillus castrilensis TaxID=2897690 RepID=A0AAW9NEF5_9BACI|nr:hypothetical protein [Peribacillus castrilensis]